MDPERFRQVEQIYHAVREGTAEQRAALLGRTDPEVRREVESLLAHPAGCEFLERTAIRDAAWLLVDAVDPALAVGTSLGPYLIEHKLGEGGMGAVYRALDTRLGRAVAIKVIHEQFSARFQREARAISSLNHPNLCTLHDVGPNYLVMELVDGETLAERIRRGPIPLASALAYASQILAALAEAHARGIIHRDLKPRNIMLAKSGIKILDFGLAKSAHDDSVTAIHGGMGTPAYMSPEQRDGRPVDARSDIWSFGCVLHEMLTGTRPGSRRARLPSRELEQIVARCLDEEPARRWQTAADLQRQLSALAGRRTARAVAAEALRVLQSRRGLAIGAACVLALGAALGTRVLSTHAARPLTDKDTIVLADFANHTGDPVFTDALRQGLSVQLEQSPFLGIVPDARVRQMLPRMGLAPDARLDVPVARDLCERLGSAAVVEGSITQIGAPYLVTLKAVDCEDGRTLASTGRQAADKDHVLDALGNAASQLRTRLGEPRSSMRKFNVPLEQATTSSLDALKAYGVGQQMLSRGSEIAGAILHFEHAIELDPQFALAYGALTIAYTTQGESRLAADAARRAYALRAHLSEPEKYFVSARYGKSATGDIGMAIHACLAWIEAYPRTALARTMVAGSIYPVAGEFDKALAQGLESIRLMPTMPVTYSFVMDAYIALNRFDEAQATYEQARRLNLQSRFFAYNLYQLAFLRGDAVAMARQVEASGEQAGPADQMLAYAAETAGYNGQLEKSRELSDQAMAAAERVGEREAAGTYLAMSSLREALFGHHDEAERRAATAMHRSAARDVQFGAALAFAYAGNDTQADALADILASEYPEDTLAQSNYLPALRAKLALDRGDPAQALAILKAAAAYEFGSTRSSVLSWTPMYPIYMRGEAYLAMREGAQAATEFRRILDHPGLALNYPVAPMARLQLARSLALAGDRTGAIAAYKALLDLWKDADPDLPVLHQASAEYARLN